jgi:hypothetical protein
MVAVCSSEMAVRTASASGASSPMSVRSAAIFSSMPGGQNSPHHAPHHSQITDTEHTKLVAPRIDGLSFEKACAGDDIVTMMCWLGTVESNGDDKAVKPHGSWTRPHGQSGLVY